MRAVGAGPGARADAGRSAADGCRSLLIGSPGVSRETIQWKFQDDDRGCHESEIVKKKKEKKKKRQKERDTVHTGAKNAGILSSESAFGFIFISSKGNSVVPSGMTTKKSSIHHNYRGDFPCGSG